MAALVLVLAVCVYILMNTKAFPPTVATAASATLFVDVVGLVATIWKVVLAPGTAALAPVTRTTPQPKAIATLSAPSTKSAVRRRPRTIGQAKAKGAGTQGAYDDQPL